MSMPVQTLNMYVVELLLVGISTYGPNYVRLIEAVSYSSTYVSLVYGAGSINGNIYTIYNFKNSEIFLSRGAYFLPQTLKSASFPPSSRGKMARIYTPGI
jgi:hypothetical protein